MDGGHIGRAKTAIQQNEAIAIEYESVRFPRVRNSRNQLYLVMCLRGKSKKMPGRCSQYCEDGLVTTSTASPIAQSSTINYSCEEALVIEFKVKASWCAATLQCGVGLIIASESIHARSIRKSAYESYSHKCLVYPAFRCGRRRLQCSCYRVYSFSF